ncbi:MAG: YceI family protein [Thermoflexales bacterium]|nr:YceI family protein [Thermoflexales bacterium]
MLKKVLIGLVIVAVLGGAALFILDRTVFAPTTVSTAAPVAPTLAAPTKAAPVAPTTAATEPTQPAAAAPAAPVAPAAPAGDARLYRIDATQSEARYEVGETFFQGNRFVTAIGRTKGVAGDILIDLVEPAKSQIGDIVIDISQLQSDESRRDNFIRNNQLESAKYPQATFKTTALAGLPAKVNVGDEVSFTMTGDLTVKQTTLPVTWQVTLTLTEQGLKGTATTQVKMSDFGIGPIKLAMLETEDDVKLVFDFVATPQ